MSSEGARIAVVGLGYVGISNAILLAQRNMVTAMDISPRRVAQVNAGRSPVEDPDCHAYLARGTLSLRATTDPAEAYDGAKFVVVATPSNYDPVNNEFDTSSVEFVIEAVARRDRGDLLDHHGWLRRANARAARQPLPLAHRAG